MFIPGLAGAWESDIFFKKVVHVEAETVFVSALFNSSLSTGWLPRAV
jgi:hypothetical protein